MPLVHIIGAGLAGLAAATRLQTQGVDVQVYESAAGAGGRCRSYFDQTLGQKIDNGNHLLMSGNLSALSYLEDIGTRNTLIEPQNALYPFVDLETGQRWTLRPNAGPLPWWILHPKRRVPDTKFFDYLSALRVARASNDQTVADVLDTSGPFYQRFWEPLTLAALNCSPEQGQARLLRAVLMETFLKGEHACRPLVARDGLGPSFVDPALKLLESTGRPVSFNTRLRALLHGQTRITGLDFGERSVVVGPRDKVIVALPPARIGPITPWITPPSEGEPIVNAHFQLSEPIQMDSGFPVLGLINATTHWIFVRENIISTTISAGGAVAKMPEDELLNVIWGEVCQALKFHNLGYEAARLIREKRATFNQSPSSVARRPKTKTHFHNLFLAGDWTDTGLPATIEGAIRSGHKAARLAALAAIE